MRKSFSLWIISLFICNIALSDVIVSIDDVLVGGYTEDIIVPVNVSNPDNSVGGFQFDIVAIPTIITLSGASPIDSDNFSAVFVAMIELHPCAIFANGPP